MNTNHKNKASRSLFFVFHKSAKINFQSLQRVMFHASTSNVYTCTFGFGVMPLQAAQEAKYKKLKWDNKALGAQSVSQKVYILNFEFIFFVPFWMIF